MFVRACVCPLLSPYRHQLSVSEMAELIENYFEDYNNIIDGVNEKLEESKSQYGSEWVQLSGRVLTP